MDTDTKNLCSLIVQHQASTGLSQLDIATKLGVRQETISGWLTGKHGITRKNALKIRDLCGVADIKNDPVEAFRARVVDALIACDGLSGEARAIAVRVVQGLP